MNKERIIQEEGRSWAFLECFKNAVEEVRAEG